MFYSKDGGLAIYSCMKSLVDDSTQELKTIANMYELFQTMRNQSTETAENEKKPQQNYAEQIKRYIEYRYAEDVKVSELAAHCGLNRSYMTKCFVEETGISPKEYLMRYRMDKAKELLKKRELPVSNVAYTVGYSDPLAFSKLFKKKVGISPKVYREQNIDGKVD